jgi:hypothetical protein
MKSACALAALLCASCMSTKAYLHPDQSISICYRNALCSQDYWISPTTPGVVNPASQLKLRYRDNVKIRERLPVKCEGFVDRTKEGVAQVQFTVHRKYDQGGWRVFNYNGKHRLITATAVPES